jgi:hypothetical protein
VSEFAHSPMRLKVIMLEVAQMQRISELLQWLAVIQRRSAASISLYFQCEVFTEIRRFPLQ